MTTEFLPIHMANALTDNFRRVGTVLRRQASREFVLEFCLNFRIAGIADLLLTARSEDFLRRAHQSGRAFLYFLEGAGDSAKLTSRSEPFFDAIAATDFDGARAIAMASRRTWRKGEEYHEDFLFVDFVMKHFFLGAPDSECQEILELHEQVLEGADDTRLGVSQALFRGDAQLFEVALLDHLTARKRHFRGLMDSGAVSPEIACTEAHLSVEGVALTRLAERKGMATHSDYPQVPSIARDLPRAAFAPDAWTLVA
jgi:hypothetical protein